MMTKEEVAAIVSYCQENKISFKQRLEELHIRPATFYDSKRKYAPTEEGENAGEFLQLVPGGDFLPNPIVIGNFACTFFGKSKCTLLLSTLQLKIA